MDSVTTRTTWTWDDFRKRRNIAAKRITVMDRQDMISEFLEYEVSMIHYWSPPPLIIQLLNQGNIKPHDHVLVEKSTTNTIDFVIQSISTIGSAFGDINLYYHLLTILIIDFIIVLCITCFRVMYDVRSGHMLKTIESMVGFLCLPRTLMIRKFWTLMIHMTHKMVVVQTMMIQFRYIFNIQ